MRAGGSDGSTSMPVVPDRTVSPTPPARHSDDRQTRRHRLEHDIAECFSQARESEDVRCGVMVRQVLPLAISGEVSKRTDPPLQGRSRRPVADQEQTYFWAPGRDDRQSIREDSRRSSQARSDLRN